MIKKKFSFKSEDDDEAVAESSNIKPPAPYVLEKGDVFIPYEEDTFEASVPIDAYFSSEGRDPEEQPEIGELVSGTSRWYIINEKKVYLYKGTENDAEGNSVPVWEEEPGAPRYVIDLVKDDGFLGEIKNESRARRAVIIKAANDKIDEMLDDVKGTSLADVFAEV